MSTRMPNGILSHHLGGKQYDDASRTNTTTKQQSLAKSTTYKSSNNNNNATTNQQQQQTNILNVAEMLLHGVADDEILDIWLSSIECQEFAKNFVDAGYDMPTISRITPQDLTAIGITDPAKRLKILTEIKKLNLQDGIPNFRPANLSHWLSLLRLDSHYHKSLCDQQIDTIEKTCQLTWEDFEELGIVKLGHQKRLLLAIERMKEIESNEAKVLSKPMSEPIYDTSPSQILLVASAENHSMNGPIINKQSSTSELSSTGSGSMHSLYSANSIHYQPTYATLPINHQQSDQQLQQHNHSPQQQHQKQAIYSQPPSQIMQPPQPIHQPAQHQIPNLMTLDLHHQHHQQANQTPQHHQNSHYQATQPITNPSQYMNSIYDTNNLNGQNKMAPFMNRQSLGQLPFSALANLPKHQQQLLQQCSIYATLSRQPQRVKQPPPPVPVRTNSLKSNSLIDEETDKQHSQQTTSSDQTSTQSLNNAQTSSANGLYRSGTRVSNRNQFNPQTLLTKNKSFSGNACMDAARARFLNRNSQQQQQIFNLPQQMQPMTNQNNSGYNNSTQNSVYGLNPIRQAGNLTNMHSTLEGDNLSIHSRQSIPPTMSLNQANTFNLKNGAPTVANHLVHLRNSSQLSTNLHTAGANANDKPTHADDYEVYSDTNSTKSLILPSNNLTNSPVSINRQTSLSQESGSSQTLYNSASSGSADHNINVCNFSQSEDLASRHLATSNSTLNDVNLILDQQAEQHRADHLDQQSNSSARPHAPTIGRFKCNATTGKDDDFPPPPSPLSLTDSDEHNLHSLNSDTNFTDISQGLMTFRVGI